MEKKGRKKALVLSTIFIYVSQSDLLTYQPVSIQPLPVTSCLEAVKKNTNCRETKMKDSYRDRRRTMMKNVINGRRKGEKQVEK